MRRAGMSLVLAAVLAAGCGPESGGEAEAAPPSAAPASPASAAPGTASPAPAGLTEWQVKLALPDPHAMGAWEPVTRGVNSAKGHLNCPSEQQCKGKWFGHIKYRLTTGTTVSFSMTTFGNAADAGEHFQEEKAKYSGYAPIETPELGDDSLAYRRNAGGLTGAYLTAMVGTVVATVLVERGDYEVTLPQTAKMFVDRIRQAQAGQTPDAGLPRF